MYRGNTELPRHQSRVPALPLVISNSLQLTLILDRAVGYHQVQEELLFMTRTLEIVDILLYVLFTTCSDHLVLSIYM